ncbi:DUF5789 family protein [Halospeciosus flavus]|uniref:DUF2795 domain-containing protein n=1 Tax=Halospeciosus flavus TaxID=3032283 RepID=A0ABD5Z2A6_9EURY|nr:hypothetical protein [Halospeciosus flavus]
MRLPDVREHLEQDQQYPADRETLVETFGDLEIEAPNGESTSVSDALERTEVETFHSVDEAYGALAGRLDEAHIGRKAYDDRSSTDRQDREEQSF